METTITLEKQHVRALAEEYRSQGYEVIEEPSQEQLPSFLTGYYPDLLLRKASEGVVVEVKSRTSLAKESQVRELARLLRTQPKWSFELVVVDAGEQLEAIEDVHPFTREDILRGIAEAEQLLSFEFSEAALLRAWSSAEATVRLLVEEEGLLTDQPTPRYMFKQAVMNGVVSRGDYRFLLQILRHRNALVHGFAPPDFDATFVRALIDTTKRLLQSTTSIESV